MKIIQATISDDIRITVGVGDTYEGVVIDKFGFSRDNMFLSIEGKANPSYYNKNKQSSETTHLDIWVPMRNVRNIKWASETTNKKYRCKECSFYKYEDGCSRLRKEITMPDDPVCSDFSIKSNK